MNLQSFFLISLMAINLMSCSKNKNTPQTTTIQGQVRTFGSEEPIRHGPLKVELLEKIVTGDLIGGSNSYKVIASEMTDENLNFSITYDLSSREDYYIGVDETTVSSGLYYKPTFSDKGRHSNKLNQIGGTVSKNYYLTAKGWVKFHFLNVNPQPSDRFAYSAGSGAYEEIYGAVDIFRTIVFAGNTEKSIAIGVTQNGIDTTWRQYFFVPAFDTTDIQIKF